MCADSERDFTDIRARLDHIAAQVREDGIALDEALDLYDEAIVLGMEAAELLEHIEEQPNSDSRHA